MTSLRCSPACHIRSEQPTARVPPNAGLVMRLRDARVGPDCGAGWSQRAGLRSARYRVPQVGVCLRAMPPAGTVGASIALPAASPQAVALRYHYWYHRLYGQERQDHGRNAQRTAEHFLQRPSRRMHPLLRAAPPEWYIARRLQDAVFKTPWPGDPRVNIQRSRGGEAKPYQVRQVLKAIEKLNEEQK